MGRTKRKELRNKGITLIALVITIIVLLILAGVTIAALSGDNGILQNATKAKEETEKSTALEKVTLEVTNSYGIYGQLEMDKLNQNLQNIQGLTDGLPIDSLPARVVVYDYNIVIRADGIVELAISLEEAKKEEMLNKENNSSVWVEDGAFILPAGFKVAQDTASTIENGIVIEEKNKNQFVWIPYSENNYVRDRTYEGIQISEDACTENGYLPSVIQPEILDGLANEEIGKINEEAEKNAVVKIGGFYIARYEACKEENKILSQKGKNVITGIRHSEAREMAKNVVNTDHAKTALCSGIQWDAVMKFIDGKLDGGSEPQTFNVRTPLETRHIGDEVVNSGNNESDRVCNIYDLEGNAMEYVGEINKNQETENTRSIVRGGTNSLDIEASSRAQILNEQGNSLENFSFRIVLYVF